MSDRRRPWLPADGDRQDRGVSTVIGAVLIFGIFIIAWTSYQAIAVPQQNMEAEFNHNQDVQGEILDFRDAILRTGTTGVTQSVTISVGAEYPRRAIAVNFAVTGGWVGTVEPDPDGANNLTITNATATRTEVKDYFNASDGTRLNFSTTDVLYRPVYTRYTQAPETIISGGTAFNQFDQTNLSIGDQLLVDGNRITIVTINGTLRKSKSGEGATVSLETEGLSVARNTIAITNASGRINITIPTTVADESAWNDASLEDEPRVKNVVADGDHLTIILKNGTYSLRMMQVGVGTGTTEPGKEYIVGAGLPPTTVFNGTSHEATVEVRDKFNNPVNNVTVNATQPSSTTGKFSNGESTVEEATATDGRVTFNWTAPEVNGRKTVTLKFNISENGSPEEKILKRTVTVADQSGTSGSGTGSGSGTDELNPNSSSSVFLKEADKLGGGRGSSDPNVDITLKNQGTNPRNITKIRVMFYYDSGGTIDTVESIRNQSGSNKLFTENIYPRGIPTGFLKVNKTQGHISAGKELTIRIKVNDGIDTGDFFFFSLKFEDGDAATYIAAPT